MPDIAVTAPGPDRTHGAIDPTLTADADAAHAMLGFLAELREIRISLQGLNANFTALAAECAK